MLVAVFSRGRVVVADDFQVLAIPGGAGVGDEDAVEGEVLGVKKGDEKERGGGRGGRG